MRITLEEVIMSDVGWTNFAIFIFATFLSTLKKLA